LPKPQTARVKSARTNSALRWNAIRQIHVYLSVFVAPSLIFFALTGALQTFRIPDDKAAPALIQKLARVHKDDVFAVKPARPAKPSQGSGHAAAKAAEAKPQPKPATEALKWVFGAISVIIAATTALGLWMALAYHKRRGLMWLLALAGAATPIALLALAAY
jgi:hypothetical protein